MILQLTTFPATSVEQYDKIYMVRESKMYVVLAVRYKDNDAAIVLDGGVELVLKNSIYPENMIVLIKEI